MLKRKTLFTLTIFILILLSFFGWYHYNSNIKSFNDLLDKYYNNKVISSSYIFRTDTECQFIDISSNNHDVFNSLFEYINKFEIKPYNDSYDINDNTSYPKLYNIRIIFEKTDTLNDSKISPSTLSIYFRNEHTILLVTDSAKFIIDDDNIDFKDIDFIFKKIKSI